jgi:hypothetical protein
MSWPDPPAVRHGCGVAASAPSHAVPVVDAWAPLRRPMFRALFIAPVFLTVVPAGVLGDRGAAAYGVRSYR